MGYCFPKMSETTLFRKGVVGHCTIKYVKTMKPQYLQRKKAAGKITRKTSKPTAFTGKMAGGFHFEKIAKTTAFLRAVEWDLPLEKLKKEIANTLRISTRRVLFCIAKELNRHTTRMKIRGSVVS